MKKLASILTLIVFALAWSCGGGSETKKEAAADTSEKAEKSYDLKTKDGMLMQMKDFNINIPDEMNFVEIKRNSGDYVAVFEAKDLEDATVEKLQNWFNNEIQELTNEGWKPRPIREDDEMLGSVINQVLFYRARPGSSLQDAIDLSSTFSKKDKSYKLFISFSKV